MQIPFLAGSRRIAKGTLRGPWAKLFSRFCLVSSIRVFPSVYAGSILCFSSFYIFCFFLLRSISTHSMWALLRSPKKAILLAICILVPFLLLALYSAFMLIRSISERDTLLKQQLQQPQQPQPRSLSPSSKRRIPKAD